MDYNLLLGALLFGSCIVFMTFVVLNLFISVILVAFNEEQKYHKVIFVTNNVFNPKSIMYTVYIQYILFKTHKIIL